MRKKFHHVTHSSGSIVSSNSRTKSSIPVPSTINPINGSICGAESSIEMVVEWKTISKEEINAVDSTMVHCKKTFYIEILYHIFYVISNICYKVMHIILHKIYFSLPHGPWVMAAQKTTVNGEILASIVMTATHHAEECIKLSLDFQNGVIDTFQHVPVRRITPIKPIGWRNGEVS